MERRKEMLEKHGKENLDEVLDVSKKFMGIPHSWLKKKDEEESREDDGLDRKN